MAITIKKVSSKKELKTFIRFNYELYKENPYSVDRKSTRLNSSHIEESRMPSSA